MYFIHDSGTKSVFPRSGYRDASDATQGNNFVVEWPWSYKIHVKAVRDYFARSEYSNIPGFLILFLFGFSHGLIRSKHLNLMNISATRQGEPCIFLQKYNVRLLKLRRPFLPPLIVYTKNSNCILDLARNKNDLGWRRKEPREIALNLKSKE